MEKDLCARTFAFSTQIVLLCRDLEKRAGVARTMSRQLIRAGTSTGANVEEAQCGQSRADFLSKIQIACKEARETHYWLRLLVATELVPATTLAPLLRESNELVAILTAIIRTTKDNNQRR